ncbi:MAG: GDSL-type esterase/lipase family protein [Clostridiales bacterium]|nr:GDSL-type esterase/lipase family protein [Clostridiales bacterium]
MKQILCFGDSNTHGYDAFTGDTLDYTRRWTGRVQKALGEQALICEAGLNGRTCGFDDPEVPGRNGRKLLNCALQTHKPLDAVVLMLGTNDCKTCYRASGASIAGEMEALVEQVEQFARLTDWEVKTLVVAPPPLGEASATYRDFNAQSLAVSRSLAALYRDLAERHGTAFADAGEWDISLDFDGTHFTPEGHRRFALRMEEILRKLLNL